MSSFYEKHDIATCPDGDKVRSDGDGLFCIVDAARVPARVVNGQTFLDFPVVAVVLPVVVPPVVVGGKKKKTEASITELLETEATIEDAN